MPNRPYLSDHEADAILAAAREAADKLGASVTIALVDEGAHLLRLARLDGCLLVSLEVAIRKARTASGLRAPTKRLAEASSSVTAILTLPDVAPFAGGLPLVFDGAHVGAIGVSGGTPEEDETIAAAGVEWCTEASSVSAV